MRVSLAPRRLFGRVALLIIGIAVAQFVVTILLYDRISRDTVREDHARRVAELLEVSQRLVARGERDVAATMSTRYLQVWIDTAPAVRAPSGHGAAKRITTLVKEWEPGLATARLHMATERRGGRDHLVGSMRLDGGAWLNFRSIDLSSPWSIIARATFISLALTALCLLFAVLALRQLGAPLRRLADATRHIGDGTRIALAEEGTSDLRNLSRAFNAMQDRITRIIADQARSFIAISHDMRTPLSRLRLTTDFIEPTDMREIVDDSVGEMEAMLASLQSFLKVQDVEDRPGPVSLAEIVDQAASRWRDRVEVLDETDGQPIISYPHVLCLALEPLIENAVQYGERARIVIADADGELVIRVTDDGPGLAEEHLQSLIEPFFRVDAARARNTPGFGLGIPRAHRLLQRFGGSLGFRRGVNGSLEVFVTPPHIAGSLAS